MRNSFPMDTDGCLVFIIPFLIVIGALVIAILSETPWGGGEWFATLLIAFGVWFMLFISHGVGHN